MSKHRKKGRMKSKIVEGLALPKDLMLGASSLQVFGNSEIYIENYNKYLIIIRYNHILKFYNTTTNKPILFNQIKNKENKND